VSPKTVSNYLDALDYRKVKPRFVSRLTEEHRRRRLEFSRAHLNDNWSRTIFSDETAMQLGSNSVLVWTKKSKVPVKERPKIRKKIMAWAAFSGTDRTPLVTFDEIMTSQVYCEILDEFLLPLTHKLGSRFRFQHDNDPKHTSRFTKQWLAENGLQVLEWPANSPDLNPIENLWGIVKTKVEKRNPKTLAEVEKFMEEEWDRVPQGTLVNLAASMKECLQQVISANGGHTSF
jgi:hypothetical protein